MSWVPLEDLDLSVRASEVLRREGITTADELTLCSEKDLRNMRNLNQSAIEEIKRALATMGLTLRD